MFKTAFIIFIICVCQGGLIGRTFARVIREMVPCVVEARQKRLSGEVTP